MILTATFYAAIMAALATVISLFVAYLIKGLFRLIRFFGGNS